MAENFGASFSIDVTKLKAGLAQANRLIRESKSEFKAAAAGMDNWTKSEAGLTAKLKSLNQVADVQAKVVDALQKEYDRLIADGMEPTSAQAVKLRTDINNQKAALNATQKEIEKYTVELEDLTSGAEDAGAAADDLIDNIEESGNAADKASNGFTVMKAALANLVSQGIAKAASALKDFATDAVNTGMKFESAMSNVAALSGATGEELDALRETAKKYGEQTKFSASEAADALGYMALAGWNAQQSTDALGGVLNLAAASGMELAQASDMVTDYMSAFNIEAKDSAYFADLLAYAQANANTTVAGLGEAFRNSAANMNAAGQDIETTTAFLAMLANQGLKGSEAGTALTAVMRDMTAKMKDGAIQIGKTNVAVMDSEGNYRDLTDILKDVENATVGMGDAEKATALSATFTSDSIKGLNLILNAGVDSAAAFEEELRNSTGTAEQMAEVMQDNLEGDLAKLNSAFEGLQITLYETANGSMREIVQSVTNDLIPAFSDFVNGVEGAGARVGEAVAGLLNKIITIIVDAAPQIAEMGFTLILSLVDGILSALPRIVESGVEIILTLIEGLQKTIPELLQKIIAITPEIVKALAEGIPQLIDGAVNFFMAIIDAIPTIVDEITKALPQIFDATTKALAKAIPQILDGALKMFQGIVDAIPKIIPVITKTLPKIIKNITKNLTDALPQIIKSAQALLMGIIKAIPTIVKELSKAIPEIVKAIVDVLKDGLPKIIKGAGELLKGIIKAIPEVVVEIGKHIPEIISAIVEGLLSGLGSIISAAAELFFGISDTAKDAEEEFIERQEEIAKQQKEICDTFETQNQAIYAYADALSETTPKLADYNSLLSDQGHTLDELDDEIKAAEDAITQIISSALKEQRDLREEDIESIRKYNDQILALEEEKLEIYRSQQVAELRKVQLETGEITQETAAQHLANTEAALEAANEATESAYTARLTIIEQKYKAMGAVGSEAYAAELEEAKLAHDDQLQENEWYYQQAVDLLQQKARDWVAADADKYKALINNTEYYHSQLDGLTGQEYEDMKGYLYQISGGYKRTFEELDRSSANAFLNMITEAKNAGVVLGKETTDLASDMLNAFVGLPDEYEEIGKNVLAGMTYGLEDEIPELNNAANMTAEEIVTAIKKYLGIASPSKVFEEIGGYTMQGFAQGITDNSGLVTDAFSGMADAAAAAFSNAHLESKLQKAFASGIKNSSGAYKQAGSNIVSNVSSGIISRISTIAQNAKELTRKFTDAIKSYFDSVRNTGAELVANLAQALANAQSKYVAAAKSLMQSALNVVIDYTNDFKNAGVQLATGVLTGFLSQESKLTEKIRAMMRRIVAAVKAEMQINSPSKVWARIGGFMADGLGEGFTDEMKTVTRNIQGAIPTGTAATINAAHGSTAYGSAADHKQINVYQTNNYSQAHSRYELYKSKQQTAAAVRLALAGG